MQIKELTYQDRADLCSHPVAKELFALMESKQTNLCCNPDLTSAEEILRMVDLIGPEICLLKTHVDIIEDFSPTFIEKLVALSEKHRFLIFEDRKFADIGSIAAAQYSKGMYHIADWAHITNAHIVPGPGIVEGLAQIGVPKKRGLLLLAQMSSKGTFAKGEYTKAAVELAKEYPDFVMGFISRERLTDDPRFLHLTPGVKKETGTDGLGQQFITPENAICDLGNDIVTVGRGIYQAENPQKEAQEYRKLAWQAYLKKISG